MRKSAELDHLLENAVAAALGLDAPHPETPRRLRASRRKLSRRQHVVKTMRHEHSRAAA